MPAVATKPTSTPPETAPALKAAASVGQVGDTVLYWQQDARGELLPRPAVLIELARTQPGRWNLSVHAAPGVLSPRNGVAYADEPRVGCWTKGK